MAECLWGEGENENREKRISNDEKMFDRIKLDGIPVVIGGVGSVGQENLKTPGQRDQRVCFQREKTDESDMPVSY